MKNFTFIILFCLVYSHNCYTQMTSPIRVKAGEDLYDKLASEIFLYPGFTRGIVQFRDGRMNQATLNYNMLIGEMQFINDKNDTLALANELTIKYITIAKDSFYFSGGYLQFISGNASAKLVKKQIIKIVDQEKIGAYDQPTSTGAITSYSSIAGDLKTFKLDVRQDVVLAKLTTYYFADKYNNFFKATKKNVLKYFPKKERELSDYVKSNNINFENENDLLKLLAFLTDY
jgi:hypothetical protein